MKLAQLNAANAPIERSNRLPVLAAKINAAHAGLQRHIKATIGAMMAAGDDLREAKRLAGHGNWLSWLRTNCPDVSERTAHLYMQFAKWRLVIEDAMAKSATVADLERDQLSVPMGLAVGPFGVVDAIAAIHAAEHHENVVKENRRKLAAGAMRKEHFGPEHPFRPRPHFPSYSLLPVEAEFTNCIKCCLSRIGTDPHQRAEFLKQARGILDALEAERQEGCDNTGPPRP
jgi:hypothetical protein